MNNNIITSPAYMAVPGNIYNTILMDDDDENDGLSRYNTNNDTGDVAIILGICIFIVAIISGAWFGIMHKEGF